MRWLIQHWHEKVFAESKDGKIDKDKYTYATRCSHKSGDTATDSRGRKYAVHGMSLRKF